MRPSRNQFISPIIIVALSCCTILQYNCEARKHKIAPYASKCKQDECKLSPNHLALYSYTKQALETNFDLSGKEILPLLKAIETLKLRFEGSEPQLNGSDLVRSLLANETLRAAVRRFSSDDGRILTNFYRSTINGKDQNLSCSRARIEDIEFYANKLDKSEDKELKSIFSKIHQNYLTKSAKRCLKHSCQSIDLSMTRLDSILSKHKPSSENYNQLFGQDQLDSTNESLFMDVRRREFEAEELKLCQFFKKTKESNCSISGRELNDIDLFATTNSSSNLKNLLEAYRQNFILNSSSAEVMKSNDESPISLGTSQPPSSIEDLNQAKASIGKQCKRIQSLLNYNLYALKWYQKTGLISTEKLDKRTFWCPSLYYWLQIDRLCVELERVETSSVSSRVQDKIFSYEVMTPTNRPDNL